MKPMMETILISLITFAATNIDDLIVQTIMYAQTMDRKDAMKIAIGRYIGTYLLLAVSILGIFGVSFLPDSVIGLLGFIPILLGIHSIIESRSQDHEEEKTSSFGKKTVFASAVLTIANGADNVGVYIAAFSRFTVLELMAALIVFFVLTAVFCWICQKLAEQPLIRDVIAKYEKILVPAVLIILGIIILCESYL
jgi:cadmium resistance transport/sequestration family protein